MNAPAENPLNHRRVLRIILSDLEGFLLRFERALSDPPLLGQLYREENSLLGHPRTPQIQAELLALRDQIGRLRRALGLRVRHQDCISEFWGGLSLQWASLEELRLRRLAAYEPVPPELAEVLETDVDRLELGIRRIGAWLKGAGEGHV